METKVRYFPKGFMKARCRGRCENSHFLNCIADEFVELYNTFEKESVDTLSKLLKWYDKHFIPKTIIPMETLSSII